MNSWSFKRNANIILIIECDIPDPPEAIDNNEVF